MKRPVYKLKKDIQEGELEFPKGTLIQPIEVWNLTDDLREKLKEESNKVSSDTKLKVVLIGRTWVVLKEEWIKEER